MICFDSLQHVVYTSYELLAGLTDLKALIFPCNDCISSSFWFSSVLSVALLISLSSNGTIQVVVLYLRETVEMGDEEADD